MPTVAIFEGVKIQFYANEHPPPHFHAVYAEFRAQIGIDDLRVLKGGLPRAKLAVVRAWAERDVEANLGRYGCGGEAGEDQMSEMPRILSAEPVVHGVLKLTWNDGYEVIVDLRGIIAKGKIFGPLSNPDYFKSVRVSEYGHSIYWGEPDNEDVDFGADRLREMSEQQAALLSRAN